MSEHTAMADYKLTINADSGYESTTEGRCTAAQYGAAIAALHSTPNTYTELRKQRDELLATLQERDKRIAELEKDIDHKDAYCEQLGRELSKATAELEAVRKDDEQVAAIRVLSYAAGVAAGWNYCVNDDNDSFQRAQDTSEALRILKKHRAAMKEQK